MATEVVQNSENVPVLAVTAAVGAIIMLIVLICNLRTKSNENVNDKDEDASRHINNSQKKEKKKERVSSKRKEVKSTFSHPWLASSLKAHSDVILGCDFSPNGKYLASCSADRSVLLWSVKEFSQKEHKSVRANVELDHATQVKFSPDSRAFLTSLANNNTIRIFKLGKKADGSLGNIGADTSTDFPQAHKAEIINIGIASSGKFIMSISSDTTLIVWDLKGEVLATIDTHQMQNYHGTVSPCGRFVASSGFTPDVKVWEVCFDKSGTFKEVARAFELKGHTAGVYSFAFNNDSTRMVTVSKDGTWKFWDTWVEYKLQQDPRLLITSKYNSPGPSKIALSPDGRAVAVASDRHLWMYMASTAEEMASIDDVHDSKIMDLAFDTSGRYLITAGGRHMRVLHNVVGYQATVIDLKDKLKSAKSDTLKERLQQQLKEVQKTLACILEKG